MKKFLLLPLFIITITMLQAQKKQAARLTVPETTKAAFQKSYPGIAPTWEKEGNAYEVNFKKDGKEMSCVIDKQGNILETETVIPVSDLPASVTAYIAVHYKSVKIKDAATIAKPDGRMLYEAEINGKDFMFDNKGKPVKSNEKD